MVVAHDAERDRLAALGLKSAERYIQLKPLKKAADDAYAMYSAEAKKSAFAEFDRACARLYREERPMREAAARARSPWKQAKFEAANA